MTNGSKKRKKFPSCRIIERRYKLDKILIRLRIFGRNKIKEDLSHKTREVSSAGTSSCTGALSRQRHRALRLCAVSLLLQNYVERMRKKRTTRDSRLRRSPLVDRTHFFRVPSRHFQSKRGTVPRLHSAHHLESSLPSLAKFLKVQSSTMKLN